MGIYALAIAGILGIAFLVFIFMAGKGWRWHQVTVLVLIFLTSVFFVFLAASVLKNYSVWRTRYQQMALELEQEQQRTEALKFGPLIPGAEGAESVLALENELERAILDRGRVWRDVAKVGADPATGQITLRFPDRNVAGAAGAEAAPPLHRLQPNTIVYGFEERQNPDGLKVPVFFMGEFVVREARPDAVVVTPSLPLDRYQTAKVVRDEGVTWALYEIMPKDAYYKFEDLSDDQIKELLSPGGWHGRPAVAPPERYQQLVNEYVRDGEEVGPEEDVPPERTWVEVELTQPRSLEVDAPDAATQVPTREFDVAGLALAPWLRQNGPTELQPGDRVVLDFEAAQEWITQGIAKEIRKIYRRPLRDYTYILDEESRNIRAAAERIKLLTEANGEVQDSIDQGQQQITYRTEEKTNLGEDLQHVKQEQEAMQQYLSTLQTRYNELLNDLRTVYNENLELVDRLRRIEQAVVNAVQQQLADVAP